ncbi:AAA family ATPase [Phenylobacterium sp.]|uniref:AAA family ATPase n=1 Tax=Phenylobacterium sp. TaxID=1871053 RepID=UPI002DED8AEB|nr:AAA family ATPase [Phenylobacterium sp.]
MRVLVMGSAGSGKSTFARRLAERVGMARIEQDALNWDPGWRNLSQVDPAELRRRASLALAADEWACEGNYTAIRDIVVGRATHLVWLDYPRPVIMRRVIWRSFVRALENKELWPGTGNREEFHRWLDPEHPIRWAWDTYHRHRAEYEAVLADPSTAHLAKYRLRHPREAAPMLAALAADAASSRLAGAA